jgi:alcohol dehydrogenase (cytochrome c)
MQLGEKSSFQTGPVEYDGLLYVTTPYSTLALDAKTCHLVWKYTHQAKGPEPLDTNRGIAIAGGRVFRGTTDAHLLALDAKTGKLLWNVRPVDSAKGYFLSSAPIIWKNLVITGTAGADWGADGMLFAFDVKDGHQVWSLDEVDASTFGSAEAAATGGGSNWTSYAIDPVKKLLYVSVGNPAPDFSARYRPGKNLYTDSVIAVDLETGKLDHYYQQVSSDPLDRDTAAAPILFTPEGNAAQHLAAGNKAGHLYVYDDVARKQVFKTAVTTIENENVQPTVQGIHACPGVNGGVEWNGPAFDPKTNLLYVGSVDWCSTFQLGEARYATGQLFMGGIYNFDPVEKARGWVNAVDAGTGKIAWTYKSDLPVLAGVTPTAGGVVFTGELTGDFKALDAKSGKVLYHFFTGGPIAGGISTYELDHRQYVAVPSGSTSRTWTPVSESAATLFLFALPENRRD